MITALELENFKGIGPRQRIEFAPLTLLFGANSAGKSTVLQALIYLHELIGRGGADVDRTELGGTTLELGGFHGLVHRHDANRAIVVGTKVRLHAWRERPGGARLHNRFLITDVGGVQFGDGIEQGEPGHHDRVSILDEPSRAHLWDQYLGCPPAFEAVGEPKEIIGAPSNRRR
jgi:hypothetical protein